MRIAIIGCGAIGRKRAKAVVGLGRTISALVDLDILAARSLADEVGGTPQLTTNWWDVRKSDADAVIVATSHEILAEISLEMLRVGKHVLVEKPAARTPEELEPVLAEAKDRGLYLHVGFNHRYHPAIRKAWGICDRGDLGSLTHVRAVYGHGGRPGYEKEWRMKKELSGGGELIDQGMHLLDLTRMFLGKMDLSFSHLKSSFWSSDVEDNAFLFLQGQSGRTAELHASWTEWKNRFQLEVFGQRGQLRIDGLGGSYGVETLTHYDMHPERMGPPDVQSWQWLSPDESFAVETQEWLEGIISPAQRDGSGREALAALRIVKQAYEKH